MEMIPVKPELKAQLEAYARLHGQSTADALGDLLGAQLNADPVPTLSKLSPQERMRQYNAWAHSHDADNLPILSDEAISRDSMYD